MIKKICLTLLLACSVSFGFSQDCESVRDLVLVNFFWETFNEMPTSQIYFERDSTVFDSNMQFARANVVEKGGGGIPPRQKCVLISLVEVDTSSADTAVYVFEVLLKTRKRKQKVWFYGGQFRVEVICNEPMKIELQGWWSPIILYEQQ